MCPFVCDRWSFEDVAEKVSQALAAGLKVRGPPCGEMDGKWDILDWKAGKKGMKR